jgi:hypothetical protein
MDFWTAKMTTRVAKKQEKGDRGRGSRCVCVSSPRYAMTTKTGPNDAGHVVWAIGEFFFFLFHVLQY